MSTQLIEWDERFSTGIASVDHEHRELIGEINGFLKSAAGDRPVDESREQLGEIFARISSHFALEERKMRAMRSYGGYAAHKADHERLLDDIRDIMDEFDRQATPDASAFVPRITDWFLNHFSTHDAELHRQLGS